MNYIIKRVNNKPVNKKKLIEYQEKLSQIITDHFKELNCLVNSSRSIKASMKTKDKRLKAKAAKLFNRYKDECSSISKISVAALDKQYENYQSVTIVDSDFDYNKLLNSTKKFLVTKLEDSIEVTIYE